MTVLEMIETLRSNIDDDGTLNVFYTDLDLSKFLIRAFKAVNQELKKYIREAYYSLDAYQNVYSLPSDFMSIKKIWDVKNYGELKFTEYINDTRLTGAIATMIKVDEVKRKLRFNSAPSSAISLFKVYDNGSNYIRVLKDMVEANNSFLDFFQPTVIKIGSEYIRITAVVDDIDAGHTLKKLFFSERDLTGVGQDALTQLNVVTLIQYIMDYVAEPATALFWEKGVGTISTVGTALTGVNTLFLSLQVGDSLVVGESVKKLLTITSNLAATIEAFTPDLAGSAYYIIHNTSTPGFPIEALNAIPILAKSYAFENQFMDDEATNQYKKAMEIIDGIGFGQMQEDLNNMNANKTRPWGN